jgi:carotenoid cleavage dioxygenase-like enzyme
MWLLSQLALKEDALPYEMDPHTLRTIGVCNFDGKYTVPTFTAVSENMMKPFQTSILSIGKTDNLVLVSDTAS